MNIIELKIRQDSSTGNKFSRIYSQFGELLSELKKKELSQNIVKLINDSIEEINASALTETQLEKLVKQKQSTILKQTEKELKIVSQNHYRNSLDVIWLYSFWTTDWSNFWFKRW